MNKELQNIEVITPPLSEIYEKPKKAKKYGLKVGKPVIFKQNISKPVICFVSDSDGCIYKEGTKEECEDYILKEKESGMLDWLPPLKIYTEKEWLYFFGATSP